MGKIATNSDVNSKVGSSLSPNTKCPTRTEIQNTGKANISGIYAPVQCVQVGDISKPVFTINFGGSPMNDWYTISQAGYPPTGGGMDYLMYMGGMSASFSEGEGFGKAGAEKFAYNKTIYVRWKGGSTSTIPASQVVAGGSYSVG